MSESIKHVSDASFEADVINSDVPVLVDYWAAWCGPCKMIAPLLDEAAGQYKGRVIIAKVNVDENPETAAKFGVRGIPTLMLFKDGKAAATNVCAVSNSQIRDRTSVVCGKRVAVSVNHGSRRITKKQNK